MASPEGLRPQARVGAQPPEAALSAETEGGAAAPDEGEVRLIARFYNSHVSFALISPLRGQLPPDGEAFFLSHPTRDATFFIFPIRYNKLCNNFCNGGIPNYAANS